MNAESNVIPYEPREPGQTPLAMLAAATAKGMSADVLKGFMDLQERWERAEAAKAYNAAFAAFKQEAVAVIKNKTVTDGPLKGKSYAELFAVVDAVTPALSKHGLSHSWRVTKDEKDWLEVTCTLKHVAGHSESVSFSGPPDVGGAKNAIQARASTKTYLERYTLLAALGLSSKDSDYDGNHRAGLAEAEADAWVKKIEAATTKEAAKKICAEAIEAANAVNDLGAYKRFKKALSDQNAFIDKAGK